MDTRTQVVVVGAGPVGLLAALQLKRAGSEVMIIDEVAPAAARSFAVVLHPRTVTMLANLGLVEPLRWQGQSFRRIVVFAEGERRALLNMRVDSALADGALTLAQDVLRKTLEHSLAALGVKVSYGWRLASFEQTSDEVHSRFVHGETASRRGTRRAGEPEELHVISEFLIGADGHESAVRQALGSTLIEIRPAETFAFFDVRQSAPSGENAELVLGARCTAMYPLHGENTRYSFALEAPPAHPLDRADLRKLLDTRLRWHPTTAENFEWSGVRTFRTALAEHFGHGRVWLAGDACHLTNPLGAQSLNVGLREARDLASCINDCLDGRHIEHLVVRYAEQRRFEWRRLLGFSLGPTLGRHIPAWANAHLADLVASLPASGEDLDDLLDQLESMSSR